VEPGLYKQKYYTPAPTNTIIPKIIIYFFLLLILLESSILELSEILRSFILIFFKVGKEILFNLLIFTVLDHQFNQLL